ncbi:hybrid-cluster NAD(P)-dependent oxidoreductase [Arenicella sp. 4NH20-0111]|uniref:2Fe-2S iron-sulfur cluster-binding protein n=1 Tax=Arenicella sp. 4NH20-0111 TaxID=3127648 RepID=UPI003107B8D6
MRIEQIFKYPVKGLAGVEMQNAMLRPESGLDGDRRRAITLGKPNTSKIGDWAECGTFERLTINPSLALWKVDSQNGQDTITSPQGTAFSASSSTRLTHGSFSDQARVVESQKGFWDHRDAQISIINLNTLAEIERVTGVQIDRRRFRANIYVRAEPWSEFAWLGQVLKAQEPKLYVLRPTDRCRATSVNPDSSELDTNIPALLLRHYGHHYCGVYAKVIKGGTIRQDSNFVLQNHEPNQHMTQAAIQPTAPTPSDWPRLAMVKDVFEETKDTRSIWLQDTAMMQDLELPFFAGMHIKTHNIKSSGVWRSYSVSKYENRLIRLTVKRQSGLGSNAIHQLNIGDKVLISGPFGDMRLDPKATAYTFVTAGIGITPIIPMLASLRDDSRKIQVFHSVTSQTSLALWDEVLEHATNQHNTALHLFITEKLSSYALSGNRMDPTAIAKGVAQDGSFVVVCGPESFQQSVLRELKKQDIPESRIVTEKFVSPLSTKAINSATNYSAHQVRLNKTDVQGIWQRSDQSLLDFVERHGVNIQSQCRAGVCGSCKVRLLEGSVLCLSSGEKKNSEVILTCCSVPLSNVILTC